MITRKTKKSSMFRTLPIFTLFVLGMLFLSSCSNPFSGGGNTDQTTGLSPQATPTVPGISPVLQNQGTSELQSFQQWIALLQQNGGDVTSYQQQYTSDQQGLSQAKTTTAYQSALQQLRGHVQAIQIPTMKQEIQTLQNKLGQDVTAWGKQHQYVDSYDSKTYTLGYEYDSVTGIGGPLWLQESLKSDQMLADYQQTVEDLNMWLTNFEAMKANANDKTPANQVHQTDLQLMQHYNLTDGRVVVVSLGEQTLRAYDKGKLVHSFLVTTGQPELPTPPGVWWIEGKKHPDVFHSIEPKGSPDWYPDTPITYDMQYHSNGYYFHDAWWRTQFGPGTNFPHQDPDNDPFAGHGSHGCVNMSTSDSAWLYNFVSVYTHVLIY